MMTGKLLRYLRRIFRSSHDLKEIMNKHEVGDLHEEMACTFLEGQGISVLKRNFRIRGGEIDIIARDGDCLAFVEVKFRSFDNYGGADHAISAVKQKRVRAAAGAFLREKGMQGCRYARFDAVLMNGEEIRYIKNAWQ